MLGERFVNTELHAIKKAMGSEEFKVEVSSAFVYSSFTPKYHM